MSLSTALEPVAVSGNTRLGALSEQIEAAIAALSRLPASPEDAGRARRLRIQCLEAIAALPSAPKNDASTALACRLVETMVKAGWVDEPADASVLAEAESACAQGWTGLLVALLLAPSWQIRSAPTFERAPFFIWPVLAAAYFRVPSHFSAIGQAEGVARHHILRLRELARMAASNPGSSAVRAAARACEEAGDASPLIAARVPVHEYLVEKGRLRARLQTRKSRDEEPLACPREGRRLEVGAVAASLGDTGAVRHLLSHIENLDPSRFHVVVFAADEPDTRVSTRLGMAGVEFRRLVDDGAGGLQQLRDSNLDAVFFATRAADPADAVSRWLASRVAPLQIALDETGGASGLVAADAIFCSDSVSAAAIAARGAERPVLLPQAGLSPAPRSARGWTRETLGLPSNSVLLSTTACFAAISPDWADRVARVMGECPDVRLLVYSHSPFDTGPAGLARICGTLAPALGRYGVSSSRLLISNEALQGSAEIGALLAAADLHLDVFPSTDAEGCRLALSVGLPVLTVRPNPDFDVGTSQLLSSLGLGECVFANEDAWAVCARELAGSADRRMALRRQVTQVVGRPENYRDPLAYAEGVGAALEAAFDLTLAGQLRGATTPVVLGDLSEEQSEEAFILLDSGLAIEAAPRLAALFARRPADARVRAAYYRALILAGQEVRAESGLTAQCAHASATPETWRQLAQARLRQGKTREAAEALRVSLKREPNHPDSWALLEEMATLGGWDDMIREVARLRAGAATGADRGAAAAPAALRKSLYFSPVGKNGKGFLQQMLERLPEEKFDVLVIAYDDTDFSDLPRVQVVRDKGQKWRLAKRHLTPEKVAEYDYVFIWDDDLDPCKFEPVAFVDILRRNDLDVAQPSLTQDGYTFHPITVAQIRPVGRQTNFVEVMCPVYSSKIWPAIYRYIDPDLNELGWGYDFLPHGKKGIIDCMSVRHTRPNRSVASGADQQFRAWAAKYGVVRPALVELGELN